MSWRGWGALLVLAAIGAAGGYLAADLREPATTKAAEAAPVPAQSPSIPVAPDAPFDEDISYPALQAGLEYRRPARSVTLRISCGPTTRRRAG